MPSFRCPCGQPFQARDEDLGQRVRCPACAAAVAIPAPYTPTAAHAASWNNSGPSRAAATAAPAAPAAPSWWLLTGPSPTGPFDSVHIGLMLASGAATGDTPSCPMGGSVWCPIRDDPELFALLPTGPPPQAAPTRPDGAWDPQLVALLGLLFTPLWAGTMAAINARRLGLDTPWWRPVGIAAAWLASDWLLNLLLAPWLPHWLVPWLPDVPLLIAAGLLLWAFDLRQQAEHLRRSPSGRPAEASASSMK